MQDLSGSCCLEVPNVLPPGCWLAGCRYRYGTTTTQALRTLYKEGGIPRFYRGLLPALLQAPLSRFGDTAANAGAGWGRLFCVWCTTRPAGLPVCVQSGASLLGTPHQAPRLGSAFISLGFPHAS